MVSIGNAHHTRRDARGVIGGGGGGSTLEGAVGLSMLLSASMTVTEVTTRIALVGIAAIIGLLVIARKSADRTNRHSTTPQAARSLQSPIHPDQPEPIRRLGSIASLVVVGVGGGLALGVLASLALATILNTMNRGV